MVLGEGLAGDKRSLRKSLLATRRGLSTTEWQQKSVQICGHLQSDPVFRQAQTVLAYFSIRQEVDLSSLWSIAKNWGFSRCVEQSLVWHQWSPNATLPLQTGAYGILEPHPAAPVLSPQEVDLILLPCVACDRQGYRLGYGGGFYDRCLAAPDWASTPTIGIVFDFAYLPNLPTDPWDQPLQAVCTETGLYRR
ncbi:5-formyltetrahydrofolate cyclo-ligase [Pantanalinema sp. GBBB05]|uniref:5-formyltetrahydrofolate cyclo-ligase n=1 Tax=Pantanalinema sp. GBBB05 TaxID=2604139 RepID=UPI001DDA24C1|nr:5-formyltetrahydrofolate cyclo-ligase [Pantanalinema sp. GBBB05]